MNFKDCIDSYPFILMEGALGERLKREFDLDISGTVAMADLIYQQKGRMALKTLWNEYMDIAISCNNSNKKGQQRAGLYGWIQ